MGAVTHTIINAISHGKLPHGKKHPPNLPRLMSWARCLIFVTYPWKFVTGNLPREISGTPTKCGF